MRPSPVALLCVLVILDQRLTKRNFSRLTLCPLRVLTVLFLMSCLLQVLVYSMVCFVFPDAFLAASSPGLMLCQFPRLTLCQFPPPDTLPVPLSDALPVPPPDALPVPLA